MRALSVQKPGMAAAKVEARNSRRDTACVVARSPDRATTAEGWRGRRCRVGHRAPPAAGWYFTHDTCVMRWSMAANDTAALVAKLGEAFAGKVASVASPTRKTLKSRARFW